MFSLGVVWSFACWWSQGGFCAATLPPLHTTRTPSPLCSCAPGRPWTFRYVTRSSRRRPATTHWPGSSVRKTGTCDSWRSSSSSWRSQPMRRIISSLSTTKWRTRCGDVVVVLRCLKSSSALRDFARAIYHARTLNIFYLFFWNVFFIALEKDLSWTFLS